MPHTKADLVILVDHYGTIELSNGYNEELLKTLEAYIQEYRVKAYIFTSMASVKWGEDDVFLLKEFVYSHCQFENEVIFGDGIAKLKNNFEKHETEIDGKKIHFFDKADPQTYLNLARLFNVNKLILIDDEQKNRHAIVENNEPEDERFFSTHLEEKMYVSDLGELVPKHARKRIPG